MAFESGVWGFVCVCGGVVFPKCEILAGFHFILLTCKFYENLKNMQNK